MSHTEDRSRDEATRDIAAAKAELYGRRDQVVAEYDERLQQLESVAAGLESGELSVKVAQDRVRQVLGDRASVSRVARAGRTQIGLRVPQTPAAAPTVALRTGPSAAMTTAAVAKVLGSLDSRIVKVILGNKSREARLELALLRGMRRSLERTDELPGDVVLLDSIVEYTEEVQAALGELESGGDDRVRRLLEYDRQLTSHLGAVGGTVTGLKQQLRCANQMLGSGAPGLQKALQEALAAFERLQQELDRLLPPERRSLFDDLLVS